VFELSSTRSGSEKESTLERAISNCDKHCVSKTNPDVEICLDSSSVCNKIAECADESDEVNCDIDVLLKNTFKVSSLGNLATSANRTVTFDYSIEYNQSLLERSHLSDQVKFNGVFVRLLQVDERSYDEQLGDLEAGELMEPQDRSSQALKGVFEFEDVQSIQAASVVLIYANVTFYVDKSKHAITNKMILLGKSTCVEEPEQPEGIFARLQNFASENYNLLRVVFLLFLTLLMFLTILLVTLQLLWIYSKIKKSSSMRNFKSTAKIYSPPRSKHHKSEDKQTLIEHDFNDANNIV
jgi:hypothetical protein